MRAVGGSEAAAMGQQQHGPAASQPVRAQACTGAQTAAGAAAAAAQSLEAAAPLSGTRTATCCGCDRHLGALWHRQCTQALHLLPHRCAHAGSASRCCFCVLCLCAAPLAAAPRRDASHTCQSPDVAIFTARHASVGRLRHCSSTPGRQLQHPHAPQSLWLAEQLGRGNTSLTDERG